MDMDALVAVTDTIDTYMYTYFLVFLLIAAGLYFTIRTKGVQFTHLKDMFKAITEKKHVEGGKSVSSFQAMMVSTASRVGTGNIAGVATAIAVGGPGAVFWMWIMALINGASAFVESTLAQIWKVKAGNGEFRGGPAYYIEQALHKRWLGIVFAISLIFCFALGFNGLQTYNMSSSIEYFYDQAVINTAGAPGYFETQIPFVIGLLLAIVFAFVLFGGTHRISFLTSARQRAASCVRAHLPGGIRFRIDRRRFRWVDDRSGHQARSVLQRGRHGFGSERRCCSQRVASG